MNWAIVFGLTSGVVLGTVMPVVFERAGRVVFAAAVVALAAASYAAAVSVSSDAVFGFFVGSAVAAPAVIRRLFERHRPVT